VSIKQIFIFSISIILLTTFSLLAQTEDEENLVKFSDSSIEIESFAYAVETAFGWDINKKTNGDQVLSPDEHLFFSYLLDRKSDTIDSIEVVALFDNDPFIYTFYGEDFLKYGIRNNLFYFDNPYKTNFNGLAIPTTIPDGWILTIPFEFWSDTQLVGRDTLEFTISGTDNIPPVPLHPSVYNHNKHLQYFPVGEEIIIVAAILETGDLNWAKAVIKDDNDIFIDELQMEFIERSQEQNYYYTTYTPQIESEFYIDIYAEDLNGNSGEFIEGTRFTSKPYKKENDILLLYYPALYTTFKERLLRDCSPYMEALTTLDYKYDLWDLWLYGSIVDSTILKQYNTVILPADFISDDFLPHIESYLNNGGNLFVTSIDWELSRIIQDTDLFRNYICSRYLGPVNYAQVDAQPGNNFSEGQEIDLVKGDDYIYTEIQSVSPAHVLLTYNTSTRKNLSKKSLNKISSFETNKISNNDTLFFAYKSYTIREDYNVDIESNIHNSQILNKETSNESITPTTPGAAAIMVDSTYKLAFLAFPFESIKYEDDKAELMDRIMNWFDGESDFKTNDLFRYKLRQNYPNPFNNHTTIQYSISDDSDVAINIYNLQGQLVETLKRNHQRAGSYEVIWNATGFSSGMYLYQIKTDNFIKTKKCIYVK